MWMTECDIVWWFLMTGNIAIYDRSFWRWRSAGACTCTSRGSGSVGGNHCALLYITKCNKITTSENLVNLIVKRRLPKISTTLVTIPVLLFLVFVDEIFYLADTLINSTFWLESRIQIIHNFAPHFTGIFTFQLVVVLLPQIDQISLFGMRKCLIFCAFPLTRSFCAFIAFCGALWSDWNFVSWINIPHRSASAFDLWTLWLTLRKVVVLWKCLWLLLVALRSIIV